MKKSLKIVLALVLCFVVAASFGNPVSAFAGSQVPTRYQDVSTQSSATAYQLTPGQYTYSPRIYTPAAGETIAILFQSSYDQVIELDVYSDVTGLVSTHVISLDNDEVYVLDTAVYTSVYFCFTNVGDDYAISQYSVYSY